MFTDQHIPPPRETEFTIETSEGTKLKCDKDELKKSLKMTIGGTEATPSQACLIEHAFLKKRRKSRMNSGLVPNEFKGKIFAISTKDEKDFPWKALVYSANDDGTQWMYIGSREMKKFMKFENEAENIKTRIDSLKTPLFKHAKSRIDSLEANLNDVKSKLTSMGREIHMTYRRGSPSPSRKRKHDDAL